MGGQETRYVLVSGLIAVRLGRALGLGPLESKVERTGGLGRKANRNPRKVSIGTRRGKRAGRIPLPVLALLALLALAALAAILSPWLISEGSRRSAAIGGPGVSEPERPPRTAADGPRRTPAGSGTPTSRAETGGDSRSTSLQLPAPAGSKRSEQGDPFEGTGMLRGHVQASGGDFPENWRLLIRPSRTLIGREHAVERTLIFDRGEEDFTVKGLPFAGYDIEATADGLNGRVISVLLRRDNEAPFINLIMVPAGFLEGVITDAEGAPQEGVPITLVDMPEGGTRTVRTDLTGTYRFEKVLDGPYELIVGLPESPLLRERKSILFRSPSLSFPNIELPPFAGIDVRVSDDLNRSIPGVEVRGSGTSGGSFTETTDADGWIRVRHVPEGRLRLSFSHPDYVSSRAHIELKKGEITRQHWILSEK